MGGQTETERDEYFVENGMAREMAVTEMENESERELENGEDDRETQDQG